MKKFIYIITGMLITFGLAACNKIIDQEPISNVGADDFYRNYTEVQAAVAGSYNGLQQPLLDEWRLTELRSDNVKQANPGSATVPNAEINDLDMYRQNSAHPAVYSYWISVYKNIRSINYVLRSLGVTYSNGQINYGPALAQLTEDQRKRIAGEALFLRAYHYFNLVRLYGGVFLITEPVDPEKAKQINRSSEADCYKLIIADLEESKNLLPPVKFAQQASADIGRATTWAAKSLLAKVYLTLNRKGDALPLLNDVITNSGHGLEGTYAQVFSTSNEMNKEIIFAVRYKAGGLGLGNPMANNYAPTNSGSAIINGDGNGQNYPTDNINAAFRTPISGFSDQRKAVTLGTYSARLYVRKFLSPVLVENDAENDFPVIRFADVLLMKTEAIGFDGPAGVSVSLINQVRQRAGAGTYSSGDFNSGFYLYPAAGPNAIDTEAKFLTALMNERRLELAFENHRFFDLKRTGQLIPVLHAYFEGEYDEHYADYRPVITIEELKVNVNTDRLLLPIPQREIDTNDQLRIVQNDGY